jgi:hypothetical protein
MPICASGAFASLILEAQPDGSPREFESCADAALSSAISPLPPLKAPVLKSIAKGQLPKIMGYPGSKTFVIIRVDRVSARVSESDPAIGPG